MSTNEKLIYGWTMHLLQVGRFGKLGPDFKILINHHCQGSIYRAVSSTSNMALYFIVSETKLHNTRNRKTQAHVG